MKIQQSKDSVCCWKSYILEYGNNENNHKIFIERKNNLKLLSNNTTYGKISQ